MGKIKNVWEEWKEKPKPEPIYVGTGAKGIAQELGILGIVFVGAGIISLLATFYGIHHFILLGEYTLKNAAYMGAFPFVVLLVVIAVKIYGYYADKKGGGDFAEETE